MVEVKGVLIDFDAEDYVAQMGLERVRPLEEWVMCACPFHKEGKERHPSFGINRESGIYHCFTCHVKGHIEELTATLLGVDREAAAKWLIRRYAVPNLGERRKISVTFPDRKVSNKYLPESALDPYRYRTAYVYKRGLKEEVARFFDLGYNREKDCLTIPWRDANGRLVFIKQRPLGYTDGPRFLNDDGAAKGKYLFAAWVVKHNGERRVFVVESEICCMWLWQHNIPAVALGGSWATDEQIRELLRLPTVEEVVLWLDQDAAGEKGTERLIEALRGKRRLFRALYPRKDAKDPNECTSEEVLNVKVIPIL